MDRSIDFPDSETALVTVQAMVDTFYETVEAGDVESTKIMYGILADAAAGASRLLDRLFPDFQARWSLGGSEFPPASWKDMSPSEIILYLGNVVAIDSLEIQIKREQVPGSRCAGAKRLSEEISKLTRKLKNKVLSARSWIRKYWPDAWTDEQESDFQEWL